MMTPGYTRTVITPQGKETFQVWLELFEGRWVAKIVTLPNRMWVAPGGREALKFHGATREDAEMAAAAFIEEERVSRGIRAVGPAGPSTGMPGRITLAPRSAGPKFDPDTPARRLFQRLLLRFGVEYPDRPGVTGNLSETGLFIITNQPRPIGSEVTIDLRFVQAPISLSGEVVWVSEERRAGASLGFGVRLVRRPGQYLEQLRALYTMRIS
jgi:hypothetical protein